MTARIHIDTPPLPPVTEGLIGHRFKMTGGLETHSRGYTTDTTWLADEATAAGFVQKLTGSLRVEFMVLGNAPPQGLVFDRRVVVVDHDGLVVRTYFG